MKQVYLLTGRPGTGKTSLVKQAVAEMKGKAGGFYTEEIRSGGARQGFRLVTLDGHSTILAHIDIHSPYRVSKYGVDIDSLDKVGVAALYKASRQCELVVIDEIGKMELFSDIFYVAENDNEIVGFAIGGISIKNKKGWLLDVVVQEDFRQKGIGTKLVITCIRSTARYCKRKIALTVEPNNPAITLYKRLGFVNVGVEQSYFGADALRILMEIMNEKKDFWI